MRRDPTPWLGSTGGILAALVPHCPFCAAASGTLLSSLGLGVVATSGVARWLVPLFLVIGLVGLSVGARRQGAWWNLALAVAGSVAVYLGWTFGRQAFVVAGAAAMLAASFINFQLQRRLAPPLVQIGKGDSR